MVSSSPSSNETARRLGRALVLPASLMVSALGMALAVSSSGWWLGWITLLPVFYVMRVLPARRAAVCGGLWGASLFAFCVGVFNTSVSAVPLSFAVLTFVPALYMFLGARLTARVGFSPYLLALGWMGVEFALSPTGLRHGLLAATQGGGVLWSAVGSFTGFVLVAFAVAYINAALLSALEEVQTTARSARLVARAGDEPKPVVFKEVFQHLLQHVCRAQPRAPPAH